MIFLNRMKIGGRWRIIFCGPSTTWKPVQDLKYPQSRSFRFTEVLLHYFFFTAILAILLSPDPLILLAEWR